MTVPEDEDLPVAGTAVILRDGPAGPEALLLRRPDRGSFAGAWVFPGGKVEDVDRAVGGTEQEDARRAAIRETAEEVGLRLSALAPLSCWSPPVEAPRRIRTWFFLAADPGGEVVVAADEVVEAGWFSPAAALAAHDEGVIALVPPTWRTLHGLRDAPSADAALASAGRAEVFRTRIRRTADGLIYFWDGDEFAGGPAGSRDRLVAESSLWRYERS